MNQILFFAQSGQPHVSISPETIFSLGGVPITNSVIMGACGYILTFLILWYAAYVVRNSKKRSFIVRLIDWIFEGLYKSIESIVIDKKIAKTLAPLPITMFFYILIQYYLGVLPIIGSITYNGAPLFRSFVADMNTTFGLAIVSIVAAEIYAFKVQGIGGGLGRYFRNPLRDPVGAFEGILEIVAQISRGIALSMRLFGNVFAGEVLLIMIAFLASYAAAAALPVFYLFELFIGAIQAYIFFILTTIFISLGLVSHGSHDEEPQILAHSSSNSSSATVGR